MGTGAVLFDHEKLEVYQVARQFFELSHRFTKRRMSRELRDQFDRATISMLANIGVRPVPRTAYPRRPDAEPPLRRPPKRLMSHARARATTVPVPYP
jgi:hypothetical protein